MLLVVSLLSSIVVGVIGFVSGRESLRAAAFEQLTSIREMRSYAIEREYRGLREGVVLDSRNPSSVNGMRAFVDGFAALEDTTLTAEQDASLEAFYADSFVPAIEERSGNTYAPEAFIPATEAGRYLQATYVAGRPYDDYDTGLALDDAGDGSAWSAANAEFGPYFAGLVDEVGYEDLLLLDLQGNVVYSAYKSVDLGVNMREEPYASSVLTQGFNEVLRSGSLDQVVTTDFERYLPSLNVPTSWVLSPIGSATDILGVLAVQVPIEQVNDVMTGDERWEAEGLGQTGESYLVGDDGLMRSTSRLLVEHPDEYAHTVIANGTPVQIAERVVEVDGTVQLQPVGFVGTERALAGETGETVAADYVSGESLVAYAPLDIDGLNWGIVARIDADEAFAPVSEFTRNLVLSTLAILLAVSLAAMVLAQVFTRPVRRLADAVRRVAAGDLTVQVPAGGRDEFGELGSAFNDMSSSLRVKQELIDEQKAEYDRLLLTVMPEPVARRYREGEDNIAEDHQDVSVVFAQVVGLDEFAAGASSEEELALLNALVRSFDEAAERIGVEKVRTFRGAYLASSGLIVPRVDNVRRAVDFAIELRTAVERFNAQHDASVAVRVGVDTGTVKSGLVGRANLAYDLWGDAVNLAHRVQDAAGTPGIYVSQAVQQRLQESIPLVPAGTVEANGTTQQVWKVQ